MTNNDFGSMGLNLSITSSTSNKGTVSEYSKCMCLLSWQDRALSIITIPPVSPTMFMSGRVCEKKLHGGFEFMPVKSPDAL